MAKFPTYEEMCKKVAEEALDGYIYKGKTLREWVDVLAQTQWIPCSEDLPELNEEAYSNDVLISLKRTTFDIDKCQMVHITKIAFYDRSAISSDGIYMDTEGWVLKDGGTLSMDEVIAWMPLPTPPNMSETPTDSEGSEE